MLIRRICNPASVVLMLVIAVTSCVSDVPYDERVTFPGQRWAAERVLGFTIDSLRHDSGEKFHALLTVRCRDTFRYDTLWLCVSGASLDRVFPRDTVAVPIADGNGNWVGGLPRRGVLERSVRLPLEVDGDGKYEIDVAHCMEADTLSGILGIGIRLEKIDDRNNGR